ncbi:hypothetical protein BC940DRAFT_312958 [Gongronella butleri]|nr:hypothetical protein BC940DRAFT_312958 [Gongronella butleri]
MKISHIYLFLSLLAHYVLAFQSREEAQAYLQRYGLISEPGQDDAEVLGMVQRYRDMALGTMSQFSDRVQRVLDGLDVKLKEAYGVADAQRTAIVKSVDKALRRLSVQGQLAQEHVQEQLAQLPHPVDLTREQWASIQQDIVDIVSPPATGWWASLVGQVVKIGDKDPYHLWRDEVAASVSQWAPTQQVKDALDAAVKAADVGTSKWQKTTLDDVIRHTTDLPAQAKLELDKEITAFTIFAHDYLGLPAASPSLLQPADIISNLKNFFQTAVHRVQTIIDTYFNKHTTDLAIVERDDL